VVLDQLNAAGLEFEGACKTAAALAVCRFAAVTLELTAVASDMWKGSTPSAAAAAAAAAAAEGSGGSEETCCVGPEIFAVASQEMMWERTAAAAAVVVIKMTRAREKRAESAGLASAEEVSLPC